MKKATITILTVLAYVLLVAGVLLLFKGVYELNSHYTHHPDPAPFLAVGITLIVSFPFALGFRYIVEAAVKYLEKKQVQ